MAVAEGAPHLAHALAAGAGGDQPGIVKPDGQRHAAQPRAQVGAQWLFQRRALGGQHRQDDADPPDVLAVEVGPAPNKVQAARHPQRPPGVPRAQQDLGPEAEEGRPVQHRGQAALHPVPLDAGHAVAEADGELVGGQADGKQPAAGFLAPGGAPAAEQEMLGGPPVRKGRADARQPPAGGGVQRGHSVKCRGGKQRQQQEIGKFKQNGYLVFGRVYDRRPFAAGQARPLFHFIIRSRGCGRKCGAPGLTRPGGGAML